MRRVRAAAGSAGNIQDVELAASGGLDSVFRSWVMGDMVAVHDVLVRKSKYGIHAYYRQQRDDVSVFCFCTYVVPVSLSQLERIPLETESSLPRARFGGSILRERELPGVVIPRAEEMDGLDIGRGADGEAKLNGGHFFF